MVRVTSRSFAIVAARTGVCAQITTGVRHQPNTEVRVHAAWMPIYNVRSFSDSLSSDEYLRATIRQHSKGHHQAAVNNCTKTLTSCFPQADLSLRRYSSLLHSEVFPHGTCPIYVSVYDDCGWAEHCSPAPPGVMSMHRHSLYRRRHVFSIYFTSGNTSGLGSGSSGCSVR